MNNVDLNRLLKKEMNELEDLISKSSEDLPFDTIPDHSVDSNNMVDFPFADKITYYITVVIESKHRNYVCEIECSPEDRTNQALTALLATCDLSPEQIKEAVLSSEREVISSIKAGRLPYRTIAD